MQQRAGIRDIGDRRGMRAGPAGGFRLGFQECAAKFDQRIAAEHRGEKQPVRLQRPADLDQGAGQVVDPVQ